VQKVPVQMRMAAFGTESRSASCDEGDEVINEGCVIENRSNEGNVNRQQDFPITSEGGGMTGILERSRPEDFLL